MLLPRTLRGRVWLGVGYLILLLVVVWFFDLLPRARVSIEKHGWALKFTRSRLRCPVCSASIESFTFNGIPVAPMKIASGTAWNGTGLDTPVGTVDCLDGGEYRPMHGGERPFVELDDAITELELRQGYYELPPAPSDSKAEGFTRKRGTPDGWCIGWSAGGALLWVRPDMIGKIEW